MLSQKGFAAFATELFILFVDGATEGTFNFIGEVGSAT